MIVVIDGPSGSGKSSIAKAVANRLGIQYLDSGALYRAVTWIWLDSDLIPDEVAGVLEHRNIVFGSDSNRFSVLVDGEDVTDAIRSKQVTNQVGEMAKRPEIRRFVNRLMRQAVEKGIWIADGRDLGSVVFPDAVLKIFMDAPLNLRAERRYREMIEAGENVTLDEVRRSLDSRDRADRSRETDPLIQAEDAVLVRNEELGFEDQVVEMATLIQRHLKKVGEYTNRS